MIKTYFEEACYDCVLNYSSNLETLLNNLQDWTQSKSSKYNLLISLMFLLNVV